MIEAVNRFVQSVMDALLGWLLALPRDAVLIAVGLGTALLMVLVRKFLTNQDLLRRVAADKRRIAELKREAKSRGDKDALQRLTLTKNKVALKGMRQEWKPLVISLVPVMMLAMWMWQRMAFIPARAGEPYVLRADFQVSAAGRLAHLAPVDGVRANGGWIKVAELNTTAGTEVASAQWSLTGEPGKHVLSLRHEGKSYEHAVVFGAKDYGEPAVEHDERVLRTELELKPVKLFGIVPGIERIGMAPWMVAYLALAFLGVPLFKRLLRVY